MTTKYKCNKCSTVIQEGEYRKFDGRGFVCKDCSKNWGIYNVRNDTHEEVHVKDPSKTFHSEFAGPNVTFTERHVEHWGTVLTFDKPLLPFKIQIPTVMSDVEKERMMEILTELITASVRGIREVLAKPAKDA